MMRFDSEQAYCFCTLHFIMDCRVKPGNDRP
jgi:hypothetical protein